MQLEAGEIRLNQNDKSFTAATKVRSVTRNAGEPVLVFAGEAQGSGDSIIYTRKVELWRGKAYIKAERLEANKDNRLIAEGNVSSNFDSIRASSGKLEYDERLRTAHYSGNVRAQKQDMAIASVEMMVKLQAERASGNKDRPPVEEIVARGAVTVKRGEQRGSGEEAVYRAATDEVTLLGKPARVEGKQQRSLEGARLVMNSGGDKVTVESGTGERAVARQKGPPPKINW
jgi:lipopolysaccharide transport protein LptA